MTAAELVTRALKLAGILGTAAAPTASVMSDGIATLNEMLFSWATNGMDIGHQTVERESPMLVDDAFLKGIRYCLAVELTNEYGMPADPVTVQIALDEQANIRAALIDIDTLQCDDALVSRCVPYRA